MESQLIIGSIIAAVAGIGLPFVLLSWLHVLLYVGGILYIRMKDAGAPQAVGQLPVDARA